MIGNRNASRFICCDAPPKGNAPTPSTALLTFGLDEILLCDTVIAGLGADVDMLHTKKAFKVAALVALTTELLILLTGERILVHEARVDPGQHVIEPGWGDLGASTQASLVCRYFTGRSVKTSVRWYSADNTMGDDSCPFIFRPVH